MSDVVTVALIAAVGGTAVAELIRQLGSLITRFVDRKTGKKDETQKRFDTLELGLRTILEDRIDYLGRCYIKNGEIKQSDKSRLKAMHKVYHDDLHGNGNLDDLMEDVEEVLVIY